MTNFPIWLFCVASSLPDHLRWSSRTKDGSTDTAPYRQGTRTLRPRITIRTINAVVCCSGTLLCPVGGLELGRAPVTSLVVVKRKNVLNLGRNFPTLTSITVHIFPTLFLCSSVFSAQFEQYFEPRSDDVITSISDIMTMNQQAQVGIAAFLHSE